MFACFGKARSNQSDFLREVLDELGMVHHHTDKQDSVGELSTLSAPWFGPMEQKRLSLLDDFLSGQQWAFAPIYDSQRCYGSFVFYNAVCPIRLLAYPNLYSMLAWSLHSDDSVCNHAHCNGSFLGCTPL
eukprot:2471056-Amphidinium_carterae.1